MWWTVVPNIGWQAQCHICIGFAQTTLFDPDLIKHFLDLKIDICTQISQRRKLWICYCNGSTYTSTSENYLKRVTKKCCKKFCRKKGKRSKTGFTGWRWSYFPLGLSVYSEWLGRKGRLLGWVYHIRVSSIGLTNSHWWRAQLYLLSHCSHKNLEMFKTWTFTLCVVSN